MTARVWIDEAAVEPDWPPPAAPGDDQPTSWIRRLLPVSLPVLVVILAIALVAVLGGFKARTDQVIRVAAGSTIVTGPYEFVFDKATIQEVDSYSGDEDRAQAVVVHAQAKNTWTESLSPDAGQFGASDPAGTDSVEATSAGRASRLYGPTWLTPGLPPTEVEIEFEFPSDFDPGDQIRVMTSDLTYGDHSFLGVGDEESWYNHGDRFLVWLPVERLPAEEDY